VGVDAQTSQSRNDMTPASNTDQNPFSDRGQTTGIEAVADDTTDPMGMNPQPNEGGAAFSGDGSGATSGYGEEMLPDDATDDEVVNGEELSTTEVISDDIDDDVA
jgi:hypothetical protein